MELFKGIMVLLLLVCYSTTIRATGDENGFISFSLSSLTAVEDSNGDYTSVNIPFIRTGGSSGTVAATFKVINTTATDEFLSVSNTAVFNDGDISTVGTLILINDVLPETNETFIVEIIDARFGAELGSLTTLVLTVAASDEPFGRISFDEGSLSQTDSEPLPGETNSVQFQVNRGPGIFGQVTVNYKITAGPDLGVLDITPTEGLITFNDQSNTSVITLNILSDNTPETNEQFTISLSSPGGGVMLAENNLQAQLTILANDVPVRFENSIQYTEENVVNLITMVSRGTLVDGGVVYGSLDQETTINYNTTSQTATDNDDYTPSSGTITFLAGETTKMISIPIIDDDIPEGDESFIITLYNPSTGSVLATPSVITVIISINDNAGGIIRFQSTDTQIISEDDQTSATFIIERTDSTLGDLIIGWSILDNNNQLAVNDFSPFNGTVTLLAGSSQVELSIKALDDSAPEIAEAFTVNIDKIIDGSAKLDNETLRIAMLYVADSDNVYGIMEVDTSSGTVFTDGSNRLLSFDITRNGGTVGDVTVEYRVLYLPAGVTDISKGSSGEVTNSVGSIIMTEGITSQTVNVTIFGNAFLDEGSRLYVEITGVQLTTTPLLVMNTSSPTIGNVISLTATVPFTAASGFISFSSNSITRTVQEPESGFETVTLSIFRGGTYGKATVTWTALPLGDSSFTLDDLLSSSATATINDGSSSATFNIIINNDNIPELDESFIVQLLSVNEMNQDLSDTQRTATVTIAMNDNPEGTFVIADVSKGPFFITEDDPLTIAIQRNGGDLTEEQIQYSVTPNGTTEFFGSVGIITFSIGESLSSVVLSPVKDNVPEINETFTFQLSAANSDLIGEDSTVAITVLANDDWNGIFSFDNNSLSVTIDEPANPGTIDSSLVSTVNLTILRTAGLFGDAIVYWSIISNIVNGIMPNNGSVYFTEGQDNGWFSISAVNDQITESNITYSVQLISVTGGGNIADNNIISAVTVLHSDDPISFLTTDTFRIGTEGNTIALHVVRSGEKGGVAMTTFSVTYQTSSSDDVIIIPSNGIIVFEDGDAMANINITFVDDNVPELNENLLLTLISTTGDAVISMNNFQSHLTISSSDDPNGVFEYSNNSTNVIINEGTMTSLIVERSAGSFGVVIVAWQLYRVDPVTNNLSLAIPNNDFETTSGILIYNEGDAYKSVVLSVINDNEPELQETYNVVLVNITNGGRIGDKNNISLVIIPESDDPYGIFKYSDDTMGDTWIAEDDNDNNNNSVVYTINRSAGTVGMITVIWEVHPVGSPSLPSFVDLIAEGDTSNVQALDVSRPYSETTAYNFTGHDDSIITMLSLNSDSNSSHFTITVWLYIDQSVDGIILAKGTQDGSTINYGLGITHNNNNNTVIITWYYLPETEQVGYSTIDVSISDTILSVLEWQSIVVTVSDNIIGFYINGVLQEESVLPTPSINDDNSGIFTIGGLTGSLYYDGYLQDVRIYTSTLTQYQITELVTEPASYDITAITGSVIFNDGQQQNTFTITTLDDDITEFIELYNVQLVYSSGGSRITTKNTVLSVLKSDYSNGLFSFAPINIEPVNEGNVNISLPVIREMGVASSVTVSWVVTLNGILAENDFEYTTGDIIFQANETQKSILLQVTDDTIPELLESYTVSLTSVQSSDIYPSSESYSGAVINSSLSQAIVNITANDDPYGIIQFSKTTPNNNNDIIQPTTEILTIDISESVGDASIFVVRASGTFGGGTVQYNTNDGTAISGIDYTTVSGTLVFEDGDNVKTFTVPIIDNSVPELSKYFFINLTIPDQDSDIRLDIARDVIINILPSDDAFGIFSFTENSRSKVVDEAQGEMSAIFTIFRGSKGTFGDVSVYWEVENPMGDITPSNGYINFTEGQISKDLVVTVNNDLNPEFHEVFSIILVSTIGGGTINKVGGANIAILTISASDYPYGLFSFPSLFLPLIVLETNGKNSITIVREFGTTGTVRVDYKTMMATELGDNYIATEGIDYIGIANNSVIFDTNVTSITIQFNISEDNVPELNEQFYIILTAAILLQDPAINLGTDGLPAISSNNNNATIIIAENDNARGIIELTDSNLTVSEGATNFIIYNRTLGSLGEVQISWKVTFDTAIPTDVSSITGTDIISEGVTTGGLDLTVINDNIPETSESFSVSLTGISDGGQLGSLLTTTVLIQASDDPYGLFGFADSQIIIQEPVTGTTESTITILREGGTIGVSEVYWTISNGIDNIQPLQGTVVFSSEVSVMTFVVSVLADDVPELQQTYSITIQSIIGGGRINPDSNTTNIVIPANDKPFGDISLLSIPVTGIELQDTQSTTPITIQRTGSSLGSVQVFYNVRRSYPYSLGAFSSPIDNISPLLIYKAFEVSVFETDDIINECAVRCALVHSLCQSFVVSATADTPFCEIYTSTSGSGNITRPSVIYYEAIDGQLETIARHLATPDDDFQSVTNGNVTLTNEMNSTVAMVTILPDTIPELVENFTIVLTSIAVVTNNNNILVENLPTINNNPLIISITANDNPNGLLTINSGQSQSVSVKEGTSVSFTINRVGSFGQVSVNWNITTLSQGLQQDDLSDPQSDTIIFLPWETKSTFSISIVDDNIPEGAESFQVSLSDPTGGAVLGPSNYTTVTIVIQANDGAAGSVGFAINSRAVSISEGEDVTIMVERTIGQSGVIRVYWAINGSNVINEFEQVNGSFLMADGVNMSSFDIMVRMDNSSELNEIYTLEITSVEAVSSDVGEPSINEGSSISTLTVEASDNPYGEVVFSQNSLNVNSDESNPGTLTITRNFGSFKTIQVNYKAVNSTDINLLPNSIAVAGVDFNDTLMSVQLADSVTAMEISVPIIDDELPESIEFFSIELVSSFLVSDPSVTVPIGNGFNNKSMVIINESDNPSGRIVLENDVNTINEGAIALSVSVLRQQGTTGEVMVTYQIKHVDTSNEDFEPFLQFGTITFNDQMDATFITVFINDDNIPELAEEFCIELVSASNNAEIGDVNSTCITINASDDPNGIFSFTDDSLQATIEEATDNIVTDSNIVTLSVIRSGGTIGDVTLPFTVNSDDLSPNSGVLFFADGVSEESISLTAVTDTIPELNETFSITLGQPTVGRLNDINTISSVTILANQDPYGVLSLFTTNGLTSLSVEENIGNVSLEIRRTFPSFDEITVTFNNTGQQEEDSGSGDGGLIMDYQEVLTTITMAPNQTIAIVNIEIFNDDIPEIDQIFTATISNPNGGAVLGDQKSVLVTILSNDNAHGTIGFNEDSLSRVVTEQNNIANNISLTVDRMGGKIGEVTLLWEITGQHSIGEVTPTEGMVIFGDGVGMATIDLTISHDNNPELDEVTMVTLTEITDNGVPEGGDETRGATLINERSIAVLTVMANDNPHGLFLLSSKTIDVQELDDSNNIITVYILREFGTVGDIAVNYRVYTGLSLPVDTMATINEDYMNITDTVVFNEGQSSHAINITIFNDDMPELTESFNISIDDVMFVVNNNYTDTPRIGEPATTTVNILANDIPYGVLEFTGPKVVTINENAGTVCLSVARSQGTFGTVGASYIINNITATGQGVDYSPDSGTMQIDAGKDNGCIDVTIINDLVAEIDESFSVTLFNPSGGAVLGTNLTITVIISKNDDANGVFTLSSDSLVLFVPEGDEVTLTIERTKGLVGIVTIDWVIEESGWTDLVPNAGNVTFQDGESSQSFSLMAINDGLPEVYESYTLFLSSITGAGGRISSPKTASIAIPASDEPNGIIGFIDYPLNTVIVQEGDGITISVIRTGGLFGSVTMQWSITPADNTVFATTTATEEFVNEQSLLNFTILTIQDSTAEVARQYELTITGLGNANINTSAADINIIVAASDNVHGVVSFSTVSSSYAEDVGMASVTITRTGGLVGDLRVNYTTEDREAFSPNDYSVSTNSLIISDSTNIGTISVNIMNDDTPEINEFFVIILTSVELINTNNGGRDFTYEGDTSLIDSDPVLGVITTTNINIQENDNARGVFSFTMSTISVTEGTLLNIIIERSQGTFGAPSVHYTVPDSTQYSKATPSSPIIFNVGQSSRSISIMINDDNEGEFEENFVIELTGVNNGGVLGDITMLTVTIQASDDPLGTVRFADSALAGATVVNQQTQFSHFLNVIREGGDGTMISVSYTITGPEPGKESEDIQGNTQGSIQIMADTGSITIDFTGNLDGFEPAENFTVTLTSATDGVTLIEGATQAIITVSELGQPYGVITFFGEALAPQVTDESTTVTFPIIRNEGTYGSTEVFYAISGDSSPLSDVSPVTGSLVFQEGQSVSSITIQILADSTPELDEQYTITLINATGGAIIDTDIFTSTFIIQANESPYGTFGLVNASLILYPVGGVMYRRLSYIIQREFGTHDTVQVVTSISYEDGPTEGYFPSNITNVFTPGQSQSLVTVDSTADAFLVSNSRIIITITELKLLTNNDGSIILPELSPFNSIIYHIIDETVANTIIGFSLSSLQATVIDGVDTDNVVLIVERNGTVGGIQLSWSVGTYIEGVSNGSLTPLVGSVMMEPNDTSITLTFTATPTDPPSSPEVFAVNLFVQSLSSLSARVADNRGVAVIEPEGVVKLRYSSFSEIEGATVFMSVSRLYGSLGSITITGVTMTATTTDLGTNELMADPITDYPLGDQSIILEEGVTSGDILLILPYNTGTSLLKVFTFSLTTVITTSQTDADTTPRLATPIDIVPVTIIDAEGGSGVFEFINSSTIISEEGSPLAQANIRRTEGVLGTVTVQLSIILARADNSTPDDQIASIDDFYSNSLLTLVTFASGETMKPVSIQIVDDNKAEVMEYFTLQLSNPQGGKAIINNEKSTFEISIVANDNQGGLFALVTHSLVLNQDDITEGTFSVTRELGLFGTVNINWRASYTDGKIHSVALGDLLVEDSGIVTFIPGQSVAEFTITLQQDKVPLSSETFTITITSDDSGVIFGERTATVTALPSGFSEFQFAESSRTRIISPFTVTLDIERTKGLTLDTSIQYYTEQPTEPVTIGQLTFDPAQAGSHFTLIAQDTVFFEPNKANESIHISIIATDEIARAFFVNLQAVGIDSVINAQAVVVISPSGTLSDLYSVYFKAIDATTVNSLYSVANDINTILTDQSVPGTDSTLSTIAMVTLEEIYTTIIQQQISYTNALRVIMSDIYQLIIADITYFGRADVSDYITSFGNSLLTGLDCDSDSVVISQSSYIIRAMRTTPTNLHTLDLRTTDNDLISLPNTNLEVTTDCVNVIFVAYSTTNFFSGPLLGNKIITVSLKQPEVTRINTPLIYRITSPNGNVFPSTNSCLIWRPSTSGSLVGGYWDSSVCQLSKSSVIEMDHIECECQSLGQFAVATPPNYGWTIPGPISCAFVVLIMIAIIILHLYYFRRIQLGTRILIMLCSAIAIFELIALVDMVVTTSISNSGCVAVGIILHLSVVSVFVWMLILIVALWLNLMGFTNGQEPLVIYIFISYGLSAAIVIATILLGIYALSMSLEELYGRVGELCFIPSAGVAGVSTALPIVITLLIAIGMLSHSCIYWTRWEDIKSLYKDTYNKRDIPLLLIFYSLIIFVMLFGGLHLYLQQIYLFFVFFGFNAILGIYSLVVYVFMSWHTLTWKHKHYPIKEEVQPLSLPEEPEFIPLGPIFQDVYSSRQSLIPRYQEHSVPPQSGVKSATTASSSIGGGPRQPPRKQPSTTRVMANITELSEPDTRTHSHVTRSETSGQGGGDSDSELGNYDILAQELEETDDESESQMDDLLYALKTDGSGFSASQIDDDDITPLVGGVVKRNKPTNDQYRMRRISIADTHL